MEIAKSLQRRRNPWAHWNWKWRSYTPCKNFPGLSNIFGFFSSLENPIDFESADKQPVDLIFTLLAPDEK